MYEIFSDVSHSNQNPGAAPVYSIYCIFISCHLCPQFLYVADPMVLGTYKELYLIQMTYNLQR